MKTSTVLLLPVLFIPLASFSIYQLASNDLLEPQAITQASFDPDQQWRGYWFAGDAELTSYQLSQARYGEMHEGTAMLMFVSEDFSPKELTKSDGEGPKVPVLKCNFEKKFVTGIYPYSMLLTVASPIDYHQHPNALKVATSSQEWCGHTYTQFNLTGKQFEVTEHSYFPGEGDQSLKLQAGWTEDAIWTRLRIDPQSLPQGEVEMVPGTFYMRLRHQEIKARTAIATLRDEGQGQSSYEVKYKDGSRSLKILFQTAFPYTIEGWEENYEEGFGPGAKPFKTTAKRIATKKLDYWNRHNNVDRPLRKEMGLE